MARNHFNLVRVRPDYFGPASYYTSRVDVGIRGVATGETSEVVACLPVALLDVAANATLTRAVSRIDVADWQPCASGLVGDLRLKIAEGPGVQGPSLLPASPYPRSDALEILKSDPLRGAFSRSDDLLGDDVIRVLREAALLQPPLTEQALRALGSFLLKFSTQPERSTSQVVQVRPREVLAVARGGDVDDADVHAEPTEHSFLLGVGDVYRDEQVKLAPTKNKISLATIIDEQSSLMLAANERDPLPTLDSPDGRCFFGPRENAGVVRDRAERTEVASCVPIELVGVGHFGSAANDHLRREVFKLCSTRMVGEFVNRELGESLRRPSSLRKPITRGVCASERCSQRSDLSRCRLELYLNNKLHDPILSFSTIEKLTKGDRASCFAFKAGGCSARNGFR